MIFLLREQLKPVIRIIVRLLLLLYLIPTLMFFCGFIHRVFEDSINKNKKYNIEANGNFDKKTVLGEGNELEKNYRDQINTLDNYSLNKNKEGKVNFRYSGFSIVTILFFVFYIVSIIFVIKLFIMTFKNNLTQEEYLKIYENMDKEKYE